MDDRLLNIITLSFSVLCLLFLLLNTFLYTKNRTTVIKIYIYLLVVNIIAQMSEIGIAWFNGNMHYQFLLKIFGAISFSAGPVLGFLFARCFIALCSQKQKVSYKPLYYILGLETIFVILSILSIFNGLFFTIDSQGFFVENSFSIISFFNEVLIICIHMGLVFYYRKLFGFREIIAMSLYCLLPLLTMFLKGIWYPTPQYFATTLTLIVLFGSFYGDFAQQLAQKERELTEKQVAIMVSQIQPHFIYNTLNSIYFLCGKDANRAKLAIKDFSDYLRMNLESIDRITPVSFENELKHVRIYLQLECMRFEDLSVIYHIESKDFYLPALSLQPIVENAVKHGVCSKIEGGTVTISSKEYDSYYEVIVNDDGIGFDINEKTYDNKNHIGIENVKRRIESMCQGSLDIKSIINEGTTVIIRIPK